MKILTIALGAACLLMAGETRTWTQSSYSDFEKGTLHDLTVRSDGRLSLAPKTTELFDASTAYLWTLAQDSHGNLYTAGGPGAKLFRIAPGGKGQSIAEFDALEIHAIAVDSKDRVYVATAPDGKIYRVAANGKPEEFYDPKQKYVWSMICDAADNLYIATGDQGEVHRVTPDGKGSVFFKSDETHARSIAFDKQGNLIVGTEPGGLVIRVSPKGEGFVLYQMAKREVTALTVGPGNEIYAAAVGTKGIAPTLPGQPAARPPAQAAAAAAGGVAPQPAAVAATSANITIPGGSDVYRISPQGSPEKMWSGAQDVVYALAVDAGGHLLIGSGNKGNLYRVESRTLYSTLVMFPVGQTTALLTAKDGSVYATTGNVGKVWRVGPGLEQDGWIESDVLDAGRFSTWGRLSAEGELNGGTVSLSARSGNLDRPQQNWSAWSKPIASLDGDRINVPAARFLQWRVALTGRAFIDGVDTAYLPQNIAPEIDQIETTPANYKFPDPVAPLAPSSPASLTLPAIGAATQSPRLNLSAGGTTPTMTYFKGAQGVRWAASDENGDALIYKVEIRGEKEQTWKLLRDKVREKYLSFDSQAFPDGDYRLRITASDSPSNPPDAALSSSEESDPFTVDNTPPRVTKLSANGRTVTWHAADDLSNVVKAEYSLDGGDWTVVDPVTKLSDSKALDYSLTLGTLSAGEHTLAVRSTDDYDNTAVEKLVLH